jgi:hypothetical protein
MIGTKADILALEANLAHRNPPVTLTFVTSSVNDSAFPRKLPGGESLIERSLLLWEEDNPSGTGPIFVKVDAKSGPQSPLLDPGSVKGEGLDQYIQLHS